MNNGLFFVGSCQTCWLYILRSWQWLFPCHCLYDIYLGFVGVSDHFQNVHLQMFHSDESESRHDVFTYNHRHYEILCKPSKVFTENKNGVNCTNRVDLVTWSLMILYMYSKIVTISYTCRSCIIYIIQIKFMSVGRRGWGAVKVCSTVRDHTFMLSNQIKSLFMLR